MKYFLDKSSRLMGVDGTGWYVWETHKYDPQSMLDSFWFTPNQVQKRIHESPKYQWYLAINETIIMSEMKSISKEQAEEIMVMESL